MTCCLAGNPALHAELADFLGSTLANPLLIPTELIQAPFEYGGRLFAAGQSFVGAQLEALRLLPGVLQTSLTFLSQGKFLEAYGELNTWFLVDVLGDSRQTLLAVFAIPGDFADSIGAHTLARVFDSVLNRNTVGNLGRPCSGPSSPRSSGHRDPGCHRQRGGHRRLGRCGEPPAQRSYQDHQCLRQRLRAGVHRGPAVAAAGLPRPAQRARHLRLLPGADPKAIAAALNPPAPAPSALPDEGAGPSATSTVFDSENASFTITLADGDEGSTGAEGEAEGSTGGETPPVPGAGEGDGDGTGDAGGDSVTRTMARRTAISVT